MKKAFRFACVLMALNLLLGLASCQSNTKDPNTDSTNSNDTNDTEATTPIDPKVPHALNLTWHQGYIGDAQDKTAPFAIAENADYYSYTDIFCVEKAGTTIQFTDDDSTAGENKGYAGNTVLVLSSWKQENGEWVIDKYGPAYAGSSATKSEIVSYGENSITYTYTTTNDNEYLRLCYHSGQTSAFTPSPHMEVMEQLTEARGTAEQYLAKMNWIRESAEECYYPILEGLTVNAIGDSYIAPSDTQLKWPDLLEMKYFLQMSNKGIGGSTVSAYVTDRNPMCNRYNQLPKNDPDIVIVEGGRNDFNQKTPLGDVNSTDKTTYSGALNTIIDGLQEKYPNAMIVCISVWNFPDKSGYELTYRDYVGAMQAVAEAQGVYFINSSDVSLTGVDMRDAGFRALYCVNADDVSHLNETGMKLVFPKFEKILAEYYEDFLSKK